MKVYGAGGGMGSSGRADGGKAAAAVVLYLAVAKNIRRENT